MNFSFPTFTTRVKEFDSFWNQLGEFLPLSAATEQPLRQPQPTPETLEEPLLRSLQRLLPSARVSISQTDLYAHTGGDTYPGYLYRQNGKYLPQAVVFPQSEQEIAALMLWASQREVHLLPWGGGTSPYHAKSQIEYPLLVVDLRYMRQIIKIDEARATAQVQGGAQWQEIEQSVEPLKLTTGQFFTSPNATVGGRIAANTAGLKTLGYGTLLDNTIQLRVVTPSGPLQAGEPIPGKPDARAMMFGNYGIWGIITEVTLRLFRAPAEKLSLLSSFPSRTQAIEILQRIVQEEYCPTAARIVGDHELSLFTTRNPSRLRTFIPSPHGTPTPTAAHLIIEIEGNRDYVNLTKQRVESILQEAETHAEVSRRPSDPKSGLWPQYQQWMQKLWEHQLLAHTLSAIVPWENLAGFLDDWEESLSSILYATSGLAGLTLTKVYATVDHAVVETLLIGHRAKGDIHAWENQIENIHAVVADTKRRWDIESNTSTLMTLAIAAAGEKLDPNRVMVR